MVITQNGEAKAVLQGVASFEETQETLALLKILALEPLHGWAISQRLKQVSGDELQVSDGSLYPALHKLELAGWITAEWKTSELGRRAKFYFLTRAGRRYLDQETAHWHRLTTAISRVLALKEI